MCQRTGAAIAATVPRLTPSVAAGHRREDYQCVRVPHGRVEAVEHPDVLVVEVDVDVAVELAVGEELRLGLRVRGHEGAQHVADVAAVRAELLLPAHRGAQNGWNLDRRHKEEG